MAFVTLHLSENHQFIHVSVVEHSIKCNGVKLLLSSLIATNALA